MQIRGCQIVHVLQLHPQTQMSVKLVSNNYHAFKDLREKCIGNTVIVDEYHVDILTLQKIKSN